MMQASLLLVVLATALGLSRAQDVVWYIANNGSSDVTTCGRAIETPCSSLDVLLQDSQLFQNDTGSCRMSNGDEDGRTSTTVNFLEGTHQVDPICMSNWDNLSIIGLGSKGSVVLTTRNGGLNGLFQFKSSSGLSISNIVYGEAFIGKATMYFKRCHDITITDCSFSVKVANTRGVEIEQCSGEISISGTKFVGDPALTTQTDNYVVGLNVVHGCETLPCVYSGQLQPFHLTVTGSEFISVTSGGMPEDNYRASRSSGTALRVRFLQESRNNRVIINNITVINATTQAGSPVLINFDQGSDSNTVQISRSKFIRNQVRYGGGVASYFFSGPTNGQLSIEDCLFEDNDAAFEGGGVFATFLGSDESNSIQITRSVFERNRALVGAGVFLLSNPFWFTQRGLFDPTSSPLVRVNLTDCVLRENRADLKEGVVNTLRIELRVDGNSEFFNNTGSAISLRNSVAYFRGQVNFTGNHADSGGALSILQGSRVDLSAVTSGVFAYNKAVFAGGAVFADSASTSKLAVEYNHTLAQGIFGSCFMMFGNEPVAAAPDPTARRFTFTGNSAVGEGQSIHSFSLRGCTIANFVPTVTADFLLIRSDGTVGYDDPSILDNTSTGPSNLFFYGASTKCYKTVANVTYLLPNCSRTLLNDTFFLKPELQCGLMSLFNNDLQTIYTPGTGLRPPISKLYTPWAGIEASWTLTPGFKRSACAEPDPGNLVLSPAPGEEFDLTIQLADQLLNYVSATVFVDVVHEVDSSPGVLLQLNGIQYAYNDRVFFTPNRALSGLALVGLPGQAGKLRVVADSQVMGESIQLLIPFRLSQCPLGYFRPPGADTLEEVNQLILSNYSVTQRIPTDQPLACQCFIYNQKVMDRFRSSAQDPSVQNQSRSDLLATSNCIQGYTVQLNSLYWAGCISMATSPSPLPVTTCPKNPENPQPIDDRNYTVWIRESRRIDASNGVSSGFDPLDVVLYENGAIPGGGAPIICFDTRNVSELVDYRPPGEFTVDICTRGYCRGDSQSSWFLSDVGFPCIEDREGVLCGQCKAGFAVTIYTTTCYDCQGKIYQGVIALISTLLGGVILVLLAIVFKLGLSPTIDSMLFFIQSVLILLSGRTDYSIFTYYLPFFNPDFTFNLCISPNLTAFHRLLFQYATPVYILLLLLVILLLTKNTRLSRFLGKHSFLQGLWLLFLISYFNIGTTSFELLNCRYISSAQGDVTEYLLAHDASVKCFSGPHLPAGIFASIVVCLVFLPMPVYVYLGRFHSRLKPLTDIYSACYKDDRRWWVALSIARRLLLVLTGVFIQDYFWRHFGLFLCLGLIQVVYVLTWPYKRVSDNYIGFIIGWVLLFVGLVTQPALYLLVDIKRAISMTTVVSTVFFSLCLVVVEIILRYFNQTLDDFFEWINLYVSEGLVCIRHLIVPGHRRTSSDEVQELVESTQSTFSSIMPKQHTVDATSYREPLLDSLYTSHNNTSLNSSNRDSLEKAKRWRSNRKTHTAKVDETIEALPGAMVKTSVTLVSPENGVGYQESGVAATSYIPPPQ